MKEATNEASAVGRFSVRRQVVAFAKADGLESHLEVTVAQLVALSISSNRCRSAWRVDELR